MKLYFPDVQIDIPPILYRNRDKADWNDYLTRPTTSGTALYHVYSFDRENEDYHYHGYYPEELAVFKQKELTSDKVKVVTSKGILMKEEIEPLIAFTEGLLQDRASQKEIEKLTPPHLQVEFDFSENRKISETFSSGERISYKDFVNVLYEENDWTIISSLKKGYDKTYFALLDEKGNRLTDNLRFDIGNERNTIAEDLKDYNLPAAYLELAQEADRSYANQISYGSLTGNIKTLTESVQNKIQRGQLSIHLSDEVYFYTLVNYTGWSYPMQQLRPEALDALKEHRSFFESINETNIERFKEKGTREQNQMYQLLKGIQKELGRSDTSTIFSEEVAISAYNLNKRIDSLTAENWGKSISEPLNSLGRDTWNILSYPANQIDTPNNDYFYQLVPYHLLEYLEHSTGQTEISVDVYEQILDKLKDRSVEVIPPEKDIAQEKGLLNEDSLKNITQEKDQKDNSRLAQAQRKLNRLKGELDNSIQAAQEHQNLTNGQPMNDKRNGAAFFKKQEQLENKVFSTMDEIKKQEERVEKLQYQKELKEKGLNRQGNGLEMSVQNIPKIREEIEKADRGESMFTKETIKRYRQELERLEAAQNKAEGVTIQPAAQSLIDEGLVNQWQKRPDTYFVKGLRRVALEMTEEGNFQISSNWKYQPKTEDEKNKVEDLLNRQSLQQEHIIKEHVEVKPQLQVAFDFSENQVLSNKYHEGDIVLYQEFVKDFYPEMIRRRTESVALQNGYDKTYFALLDENNNELVKDIRFDLGDSTTRLSEECENYLPPKYLTIAKEIDQNYFGDQSSIQEVTENIKKAPEQAQEQMVDRTSGGTGSLQPEAEGSTSPVLETSTFERSVTSRPTSSYPYLHFTTNYAEVQKRIGNYHPITPVDLKRLNQYAPSIQSTARWYLDELADSKISFIYADKGIENILEGYFPKRKLYSFIRN